LANPEHLAKLKEGVEAWNPWRKQNPDVRPDLRKANLGGGFLERVDLRKADLREANLREARLGGAELQGADFREAILIGADLTTANLEGASLSPAYLSKARLVGAKLTEADLSGADLTEAILIRANLRQAKLTRAGLNRALLLNAHLSVADLCEADLSGADLGEANLVGENLRGADPSRTGLVETNLEAANLTGCSVYGISAWNVRLERALQSNLVITPEYESPIQVDNLEVAQFIYLLLNNERIRGVIDAITSKVVLILGRFTPERKGVLDSIRDELRKRDYLPVLFDFEKPASKDLTGTISTLANMARFIIADLTDPSSVPHELATVVPGTVVPLQTIILEGQREYAMFPDLMSRHHWVLEPHQYKSKELLIAQLSQRVIAPAEAKAKELAQK
jgi:uncharacterized protein YjbI with pentapeptide repeats